MRKYILILVLFAQPGFAAVQMVKDCPTVESLQHKKGFVSASKYESLESLTGKELQVANKQIQVAQNLIPNLQMALDSDYTYKLFFLGKTYDALNVDLGSNGQTLVFIEGSARIVNFGFFDGDLYVEGKHCHKVDIPDEIQLLFLKKDIKE